MVCDPRGDPTPVIAAIATCTLVIDDFADPLVGVDGQFGPIIVQTVFEHLDHLVASPSTCSTA